MPTYAILEGAMLAGKRIEQVGSGYNAQLLRLKRRAFNSREEALDPQIGFWR